MLRTWNGHFYVHDTEVSEAEYNAALSEIREKCALERDVLTGAKTIEEVPADWREEIAAIKSTIQTRRGRCMCPPWTITCGRRMCTAGRSINAV